MRRDEAIPAAAHVFSAADLVAQFLEALADDLPGTTGVVPLKIADVLKDDVARAAPAEDVNDLVKKSSISLIPEAILRSRLGKRLAREARTQNVVLRDGVSALADVSVNDAFRVGKVPSVEVTEFRVDLGRKDAFVT